jgi:hypothetical protein
MGICKSPHPFRYRDHHMEMVIPLWKIFPYGDFYLNPQMETNSIWKRVSDWTVPVWKQLPVSIRGSQYRKKEPCHQTPHMEMGLAHFHMGMCLTPFPYDDRHMEMGTCFIVLPIWKRGFPYGNRDLPGMRLSPFPYGDRRMETGSCFIGFPLWKRGFSYGNGYPHFYMVIPISML